MSDLFHEQTLLDIRCDLTSLDDSMAKSSKNLFYCGENSLNSFMSKRYVRCVYIFGIAFNFFSVLLIFQLLALHFCLWLYALAAKQSCVSDCIEGLVLVLFSICSNVLFSVLRLLCYESMWLNRLNVSLSQSFN